MYSWVSRDVINFTGGQLQIDTLSSDWKCVQFREICLLQCSTIISKYILGWPPLRITEKGSSETQE